MKSKVSLVFVTLSFFFLSGTINAQQSDTPEASDTPLVSVNLNELVSTGGTKYLGSYLYGKEHYLSGNPGYRAGKEHYLSPSSLSSVGSASEKQEFDTMDDGEKARIEQHIDRGKLDEKVKEMKLENQAKEQILKEETKEERKSRLKYDPPKVVVVPVK